MSPIKSDTRSREFWVTFGASQQPKSVKLMMHYFGHTAKGANRSRRNTRSCSNAMTAVAGPSASAPADKV